jgi:hypothetical protein
VLLNPKFASFDAQSKDVREAARAGGFRAIILAAASAKEIDEAFTTFAQEHVAALYSAPTRIGKVDAVAHQPRRPRRRRVN